MRRVLVLNSTLEPLSFINEYEAMILVYLEKVDVLSIWVGEKMNTPTRSFDVPAVLRLKRFVRRPNHPLRFNRRVLFNRDNWTCQYCGKHVTIFDASVDHVFPKTLGGPTTWTNCVTSCKSCNKKKADKTIEEFGIRPLMRPRPPSPYHLWDRSQDSDWHDDWEFYFLK